MKRKTENFKENKNIILWAFVSIFLCTAFDQITKHIALEYLMKIQGASVAILPFFNFTLVLNTGVSFGIFAEMQYGKYILSGTVTLIIIFLIFMMLKEKRKMITIAYSFVISGAIGNTIDRLIYGGVIDFLDFHIKDWHYPVFNGADSIIFIGAVVLIFSDYIYKFFKKHE